MCFIKNLSLAIGMYMELGKKKSSISKLKKGNLVAEDSSCFSV